MSAENVKVCIRFRNGAGPAAVKFQDDYQVTVRSVAMKERGTPKYTSRFDRCWQGDSSQKEVYHTMGKPLLGNIFDGYNSTLFVYGQTGSGKTYTMFGPDGGKMDDSPGVVPRLMSDLFGGIAQRQQANPDTKYTVIASIVDIYLEKVRDLLNKEVLKHNSPANNLKVRWDRRVGVYITYPDDRAHMATEVEVTGCGQVVNLINQAIKLRAKTGAQAKTKMNEYSSRSHLCIILKLQETTPSGIKTSKLLLCDLAGSEKVRNTGAVGTQLKQAQNINYGLSVLGNVLNTLTDSKRAHRLKHGKATIPFRESKLTQILQDSLGGNSKTALICTCRPDDMFYGETISTLRFGSNAKKIRNQAHKNETLTVAQYKKRMQLYERRIQDFETTLVLTERKYEAQSTWSRALETDLEGRGVDIQGFAKEHNLMSSSEIEEQFRLAITSPENGLSGISEGQSGEISEALMKLSLFGAGRGGKHNRHTFCVSSQPGSGAATPLTTPHSRRVNAQLKMELHDAQDDILDLRAQLSAANAYCSQLEGENFDYSTLAEEWEAKGKQLKHLQGQSFEYKTTVKELRDKVKYLESHNKNLEQREDRQSECINLIKNVRATSMATSMRESQRELKRIQKAISEGQSEEIVEIVTNLVQQGEEIKKLKAALSASQEQNKALHALQDRERETRSQNEQEILGVWTKYKLEKSKWEQDESLLKYRIHNLEVQMEEMRCARDEAQKNLRQAEGLSRSSSDIKRALSDNPSSFFKFLRASNMEKRLNGKSCRRTPKRRKRRPDTSPRISNLSLEKLDNAPEYESGMTSPVA